MIFSKNYLVTIDVTCRCPCDLNHILTGVFFENFLDLKFKNSFLPVFFELFRPFYPLKQFLTCFEVLEKSCKSKMADQNGCHSDIMTQFLCHVTISRHKTDIKGDIFQAYYLPSNSRRHSFLFSALLKDIPPSVV